MASLSAHAWVALALRAHLARACVLAWLQLFKRGVPGVGLPAHVWLPVLAARWACVVLMPQRAGPAVVTRCGVWP